MAKKEDTVEQTVTINRKKLVTAGWIAGGVLALGATFAAGAAIGHITEGPRGGDFVAGQSKGPGEFGPHGGHGGHGGNGMSDGDGGEHGDQAGRGDRDRDRDGNEHGGHGEMMVPPAPTAPAPTTTP